MKRPRERETRPVGRSGEKAGQALPGRPDLWLPLLVFPLIFLFHLSPFSLSDVWWHLNTGRWIWQHHGLPSVDPFTFTAPAGGDARMLSILRGYFLAQLSFYFVHSWLGLWGLEVYKSLLLTSTYWLLWRHLRWRGVDRLAATVLVGALPFVLFRFDELRPQNFTFLLAVLVLHLIEKLLDGLRAGAPIPARSWVLVPLLALLWANLHQGFLICWLIVLAYLLSETAKKALGRGGLATPAYARFCLLSGVAILATFANPNGAQTILGNVTSLGGPFTKVVEEFLPLWKSCRITGMWRIFWGCLAVSLLAGAALARSFRSADPAHLVLYGAFTYAGFSAFRFTFLMVVVSLAVAAPYLAAPSRAVASSRARPALLAAGFLLLALLGSSAYRRTAFVREPTLAWSFPDGAMRFLRDRAPEGPLFNAWEYGGYLGWKLYPRYRMFIDQRTLDFNVFLEYGRAWKGAYREVFDKYGINTVVFFLAQPGLDRIPPLNEGLLGDPAWEVAFLDRTSVVFVRASAQRGLPVIDKAGAARFMRQQAAAARPR